MAVLALLAALAVAEPVVLVACAPGYPGNTAEAQPAMDALASALASGAGLPPGSISAVYHESESAGLERLARPDAALAMVTLPFYLQHAAALKLQARLDAVQKGGKQGEVWSLVAKKGRVTSPASLEGWQLASVAGYSPGFVKGAALAGWGRVPAGAQVVQSGQVLSQLRKAAAGENVAVLLDGPQSEALGTLPFAAELEVVARSAPLPSGILATVGKQPGAARWQKIDRALRALRDAEGGAAALDGIRMQAFVPLDEAALAKAKKDFAAAGR
jgi:hypothetical protein